MEGPKLPTAAVKRSQFTQLQIYQLFTENLNNSDGQCHTETRLGPGVDEPAAPKRRRCNPFGQSPVPSRDRDGPTISSRLAQTPRNRFAKDGFEPSPFSEAALAQMSPDKMAKNLCNEIKRLHKGKQLPITAAAIERLQNSESSGSEMGSDSPPNLMRHCEKPLFTFQQVQLICEGMIKERENQLRERYESVLATKLHKQHDAFVKFTYDQIQCRYKAAPSYLS